MPSRLRTIAHTDVDSIVAMNVEPGREMVGSACSCESQPSARSHEQSDGVEDRHSEIFGLPRCSLGWGLNREFRKPLDQRLGDLIPSLRSGSCKSKAKSTTVDLNDLTSAVDGQLPDRRQHCSNAGHSTFRGLRMLADNRTRFVSSQELPKLVHRPLVAPHPEDSPVDHAPRILDDGEAKIRALRRHS